MCLPATSCSLDPFRRYRRPRSRPNGVDMIRTDYCTMTVRLWHGQHLHSLSESVICTYSVGQSNAEGRGCRPTLQLPAWAMRWPLVLPISPFTHRQCWQTIRFPGIVPSVNSHFPGLLIERCLTQPYLPTPADQQRACLVSNLSHIASHHIPKAPRLDILRPIYRCP